MTVQKPRIAVTAKGPRTRERAKVGSHAILILPDAHHPFHDARVMAVIEAVAAAVRPARIVSLGDWLDAAATWQYLKGNHEGHVDRACIKLGAMGMAVLDMLDPQRVLGRDRPWVKFTPYVADYAQSSPTGTRGAGLSHYKIARDLWAVHGWSVAKAAAQRHLDMAKTVSIVHGHTHRMQHVTGRVMEDNRIVHAWSPGCLSDLQPRWHHTSPTEWAHGFSLVYAADDCLTARRPRWTPYTITVDRGECVLPGGTRVAA
jgi:hypothetical protein